MRMHMRVLRFLAVSAWDLLLPDILAKPLKLAQNFYNCFLPVSTAERLELLREARGLTGSEVDSVIDALAAEWRNYLPGGKLSDAQRGLLRQLVEGLHAAGEPAATTPSEVLRRSLNGSVLARSAQLSPVQLQREQEAVGRSVLQAALAGQIAPRGPRPLPADPPDVPGYTLEHVLGDGGFSVVYLATHQASGERRAVKVGPLEDPVRFQREVRLLDRLAGPHVVRYFEHGELPGRFWISMEYLGELTLADLIRTRPPADQALVLAGQVLRGLDSLHSSGVVHRDLKPENAMVDAAFRLRLIDFGLARPMPGSAGSRTVLVTTGLIGTPRYMSPEQIRDQPAAAASDVWSFGCILYELLTGQSLFESNNIMALGHEIMSREIDLGPAEIPEEVRPLLERCLRRTANERWEHAGAALGEFDRAASTARRRLRHERYRESWGRVLERHLLERFAEEVQGQVPPDAAAQFTERAQQAGIAEIDEERLQEILPPICGGQQIILDARQTLARARQELQQAMIALSASDLARRVEQLGELEKAPSIRQRELRETIEGLLVEEVRTWQEKQAQEAEAERMRQEAERHRREQEEAKRRQQEEAERARRAQEEAKRQQQEEERRRQEEEHRRQRAKQVAQFAKIVAVLVLCAVLGAVALGLVGAVIGAIGWQRVATILVVIGLLAMPWVLNRYVDDPLFGKDQIGKGFRGGFINLLTLFCLGGFSCCGGFSHLQSVSGSDAAAAIFGLVGGILGTVVGLIVGVVILARRA
jgi:Protein kinase domain